MNRKNRWVVGRRVLWLLLAIILAGAFGAPVLAQDGMTPHWVDTPGSGAEVDGLVIVQFTPTGGEPAGSFVPFLSLDDGRYPNTFEEGFNTEGALQLDTVETTTSILLSRVPMVNVAGYTFREFALDLNEYFFWDAPMIILDDFNVGIADTPDLTGFVADADPDGIGGTITGVTPVYAMDYHGNNDVAMSASMGTGPGNPEYLLLVPQIQFEYAGIGPDCDYGSDTCTTYVYVYAGLGFPDSNPEVFGVGAEGPFLQPGNLVVTKITDPVDVEVSFDYTVAFTPTDSIDPIPLSIGAGATSGIPNALPGTYQVTEAKKEGWVLMNIVAEDPTGDTTVEPPTSTVKIAPGETVHLTYENWRLPIIIACKEDTEGNPLEGWTINLEQVGEQPVLDVDGVSKQTGADGCVAFRVELGETYVLSEGLEEGWALISPQRNYIEVEADEAKVYGPYTFVNFQNAPITACKQNLAGEPLDGWVITLDGPRGSQSDETPQSGCVNFDVTAPGPYTLTEELQEGWIQMSPDENFTFVAESGGEYGPYTFINEEENAGVGVEKYVSVDDGQSWEDADEAPGPSVAAGGEVVWFRYVISNTGNVTIQDIFLSDGVLADELAAGCTISTTLELGQSTECAIGPFEAVVGDHTNLANVTAKWQTARLTDDDPAHYRGMTAGLVVTKIVDWDVIDPDPSKVFTICIQGPMPDETVYLDVEGLMAQTTQCVSVDFDGGTVSWEDLLPGDYQISEQNPGEVWLVEMDPPGGIVTLEPEGQIGATISNTYRVSSISDWVWYDANGNGLQDEGESGLEGATVTLYKVEENNNVTLAADVMVGQMTTGADGLYAFGNLLPGNYYLVFELPEGYYFALANVGTDDAIDSDADSATGVTETFALPAGVDDDSWDCGATQVIGSGVEVLPPSPWADPICAGWKLNWTLAFTNTSPIPLHHVRLVNYHPEANLDLLVGSSSPGAALDEDGHVYWEIEMVGAGERAERVLAMRPWSSIPAGTVLTDCIQVFTDYGESEIACGDVTIDVCVTPTPTPTATATPTATSTPSPTPTMTPTPSPTPTTKPSQLYIPLVFKP